MRKLREYQQRAIDETEASIMFGSENLILEATTSWGKSTYISGLCKLYSDKHIVIMVNIEPLIDQIAETLSEMNIEYSILKAGRESEFDATKRINIVMSQTYYARASKLNIKADIVIIDERHREYNTTRTDAVLKSLNPNTIIGCTATPYDASGFQLHQSEIIQTATAQYLTEKGYLAKLKFFVPKWSEKVDYSSVKRSGSDYSMSSLDELIGTKEHIQNIVKAMNDMKAKNKKTLVFSSTIEMCDKITKALIKDGYSAASYHSGNSKKENERIMNAFKHNKPYSGSDQELKDSTLFENTSTEPEKYIKCIVSVSKLNIGFSVEDIDLGVIIRKMGPRSLWVQSGGRLKRKSDSIDNLLKKYTDTSQQVAFVSSLYDEHEKIKKQLSLRKINHISVYQYQTEPEGYDAIEYNVRPNKEYGEILDLAQCINLHGFPDDLYNAPTRQLYSEDNKIAIKKATEHLSMENLVYTIENGINEITRDKYNQKIQEIKSNRKKLSEMTTKELSAKMELETDPIVIISIIVVLFDKIHNITMNDDWGNETRGYKSNKDKIVSNFVNANSIEWISELWVEKLPEQTEYRRSKYIKSLRTRGKNMLKQKASVYGIRYFIDFLIDKDNEEMIQVLTDEDTGKDKVIYEGIDITDDIPF